MACKLGLMMIKMRFVFMILAVMILTLPGCGSPLDQRQPSVPESKTAAPSVELEMPTPSRIIEDGLTTVIADSEEPSPAVTVETESVLFEPSPTGPAPTDPVPTEVDPSAAADDLDEFDSPKATAKATPAFIDYNNVESGISFRYPTKWTVDEEVNAFVFRNGTIELLVQYRNEGGLEEIWGRTGIPAGDFTVLDGPSPFLGQTLNIVGLVYEDRLKMVFYGGQPVSTVESEGMEFVILLEARTGDYLSVDIPDDILEDAEAILASFKISSTLD